MNASHRFSRLAGVLLVSVMSGPSLAQETMSLPGSELVPVEEKQMAYLVGLCETCHGDSGRSQRPDVPSLAGRNSDALFAEIERFYFYERICPDVPVDDHDATKGHMSMCDVTSQMNKQEALALAEYFESQTPSP